MGHMAIALKDVPTVQHAILVRFQQCLSVATSSLDTLLIHQIGCMLMTSLVRIPSRGECHCDVYFSRQKRTTKFFGSSPESFSTLVTYRMELPIRA